MADAQPCFLPDSPPFPPPPPLRSLLVAQVTCQRRARRTAGPPTAATSRSTAATIPTAPWWKVTRSVRMKKPTPPPGVCSRSSCCVLCAGGLLQRHQSGLHRRSQRVARFSDDGHHHPVPLPVSGAGEMFLNVFSPHLERLRSSRPTLPAFYRGFYSVFHRRRQILWGWICKFDLSLCNISQTNCPDSKAQ